MNIVIISHFHIYVNNQGAFIMQLSGRYNCKQNEYGAAASGVYAALLFLGDFYDSAPYCTNISGGFGHIRQMFC